MAKKKKIIAIASVLGATYIVLDIIAKKRRQTVYMKMNQVRKIQLRGKKSFLLKMRDARRTLTV